MNTIQRSEVKAARDRGETLSVIACANAHKACANFSALAAHHIIRYLEEHGESSGEDITDSCKKAGITPHDDRAFGAVYAALSRNKLIGQVGFCLRRKGHGTAGGRIWGLIE